MRQTDQLADSQADRETVDGTEGTEGIQLADVYYK